VLFPGWTVRSPLEPDRYGAPEIPPPPTADEDLTTKPAAQAAYRASYPTGYAPLDGTVYERLGDEYRRLYYRLHADVDEPLDRVRRAVTEGEAGDVVFLRTSDHGELLGAHGGLHQKWFTLYDEATRVPFTIVRIGAEPTRGRVVETMATSHVDIVPTLLAAARIDTDSVAPELAARFTEFHPLPGSNLMPVVEGGDPDRGRTVYLMTRDNIMEGDTGASAVARGFGLGAEPPPHMMIEVPVDVAANFEAIVTELDGHHWKLVRSFDDPNTWTEPGDRHMASSGAEGPTYRTEPLPDEWELYDLTSDPIERRNRWDDPSVASVRPELVARLDAHRTLTVPARNRPWPYASRLEQ
jgi:arylsulfatase A-like enzyme